MKITETTYKNVAAIECETEKIKVKFLPQNGCRMQSVIDKETGTEFMALDKDPDFKPQFLGGSYFGLRRYVPHHRPNDI